MAVNFIHDKISVLEKTTHLVEDIRWLSSVSKDIRIDYRSKVCNRGADKVAKSAHMHSLYFSIVLLFD